MIETRSRKQLRCIPQGQITNTNKLANTCKYKYKQLTKTCETLAPAAENNCNVPRVTILDAGLQMKIQTKVQIQTIHCETLAPVAENNCGNPRVAFSE